MFGEVFHCSACDFEFTSGWSHHAGGQFLVCRDCGTHFLAGGGSSCWGPQPDERLQLFQYRYVKRLKRSVLEPTAVFRLPSDPLEPLACPACHHRGRLTDILVAGESCPGCHAGVIEHRGGCIY